MVCLYVGSASDRCRPIFIYSSNVVDNYYNILKLCCETLGGLGSTLVELIKEAAAMRGNKLTHGEYEAEATWSTRKFTPFVMQRISVAIQIAAASEIRQALGMSLALSAA